MQEQNNLKCTTGSCYINMHSCIPQIVFQIKTCNGVYLLILKSLRQEYPVGSQSRRNSKDRRLRLKQSFEQNRFHGGIFSS